MASSSFPCSARVTPARYILFASTERATDILAGVWERRLTGNIAANPRQAIHTQARDEPQRTRSAFGEHRQCLRSTANIIRKCHPQLARRATDGPPFDARPENFKYQSEYWKPCSDLNSVRARPCVHRPYQIKLN